MRILPIGLAILLLPACPEPDVPRTCEGIEEALQAELIDVRSCEADADCGQVMAGTSCGCTRNFIARRDADLGRFQELSEAAVEAECDFGFDSTCDCPEAYGYLCDAGTCSWDYAEGVYLPDCRADRGDAYEITGAAIAGDTLVVGVSYGGGCEAHDFTLCWPDQSFAESDPVQARLELIHDGHADACDAYLSEDVDFDLAPLQEAWTAAYGAGPGTVIVDLGDQSLEYTF